MGKNIASVLLKLFINSNEICITNDAPSACVELYFQPIFHDEFGARACDQYDMLTYLYEKTCHTSYVRN